jgi:hypothetical protein
MQAANRPTDLPGQVKVNANVALPNQRVKFLAVEHVRCIGEFLGGGRFLEADMLEAWLMAQVAALGAPGAAFAFAYQEI